MTRREIIASIIAAVFVLLSMYQCGTGANDRKLKADALDALDVSRGERDALRTQFRQERMLRELGDQQVVALNETIGSLAAQSNLLAGEARALRTRSSAMVEELRRRPDTASMVPRVRFDSAMTAATDAIESAAIADSARAILADTVSDLRTSIDSIQTEGSKRILAAIDSVKAHLARDDARQPTVEAGVNAGSERCGWGPFGLLPCVSRKAAAVGGVVVGALGVIYGGDVVQFIKRKF